MTDEAQAVRALAETSGKLVDAVSGLGRYAKEVFGTIPHDLVAAAGGDWLRQHRVKSAIRYEAEVIALLEQVDPVRVSAPSPSVLLPWMSASADEEREELRALWAALLANASIDGGRKVRREFFDTLKQLEPVDATVFKILCDGVRTEPGDIHRTAIHLKVLELGIANIYAEDIDLAFNALQRLNCIKGLQGSWQLSLYGLGIKQALTVI